MPDLDMICNVNTPASSHLACRACGYSFAEGEPVSVRFVPLNGSMIESGAYHDRCVGVVPVGAYDGPRSPAPASEAFERPREFYVVVAEELLPSLQKWSGPWMVKVSSMEGNQLELVFRSPKDEEVT